MSREVAMSTYMKDYIVAAKTGDYANVPLSGLIVNSRPDPAVLEYLRQELDAASSEDREAIVDLLVKLGLEAEPLTPRGAEVLRDQQIIGILAGPALARDDIGRYAAMDALRKLVTHADLALHEDAIVRALLAAPSEEAFLLVAKAKPVKERVLVEQLARSPEWKKVEAAKIVRAALGAKEIEDEFLSKVDEAKDGKGLVDALGPLALMGTPRSLKAIAVRLRTPLTIIIPTLYEKSVRLNVLEALLYNFPDQPVLYPNNIITEEDYRAAERFCTESLGVTYTTPPPPFMTYRGFPRFE
jgi:hypothetical protein